MMNTSKMSLQEKTLYHQIHPLKLLADWLPGLGSIYFMWQHRLVVTLLFTFIPAILASLVVMNTANLEPYRESKFGRYIKQYMTPLWMSVRFGGLVIFWIGAWLHSWWLILLGLLVVILGWVHGLLFSKKLTEA